MAFAVFDVFPEAVVKGKWQIGKLRRGTETGNTFTDAVDVDVIEDEVTTGNLSQSPDADGLNTNTLLYCRPDQLPTLNTSELVAGYLFRDSTNDTSFMIINAAIGKNQHTGEVEHAEFTLKMVEAFYEQ